MQKTGCENLDYVMPQVLGDLQELGVELVAVSGDPRERAESFVSPAAPPSLPDTHAWQQFARVDSCVRALDQSSTACGDCARPAKVLLLFCLSWPLALHDASSMWPMILTSP